MKLTVKGSSAVDPQSGGTLSPYTSHSLYLCRAGRQPPCARGERCGVQCSSGAGGHQERDQLLLQTAAAGGGLGQELPPLPLLGQGGHLHWWEQTGGKPLPPPSLTRSLLNTPPQSYGASRSAAKEGFTSLFLEKTGNQWEDRGDSFIKKPNKFYPLEIDYGTDEGAEPAVTLKGVGSKSTLHPAVQDLVRLIFDVENMKRAMLEFEVGLLMSGRGLC